jgi:glycine/D-amino acid oxidase-like deaminating enzyme
MNADTGHHTAIPADAVIFAMGAWSLDLNGTKYISIPVISGIGKLGDDW